jgi:hypothetical protein
MMTMLMAIFYVFINLVFFPFSFFWHQHHKNIMFPKGADFIQLQSFLFPQLVHPAITSLSYASTASMDPRTQGL